MADLATIIHADREARSLRCDIEYACSNDPDWMLATVAAGVLGVSRQFVADLVKRGILVGVQGTRAWVYKPSVDDRVDYIEKYGTPTRGGARVKGETAPNNWLKNNYPELSKEVWA